MHSKPLKALCSEDSSLFITTIDFCSFLESTLDCWLSTVTGVSVFIPFFVHVYQDSF